MAGPMAGKSCGMGKRLGEFILLVVQEEARPMKEDMESKSAITSHIATKDACAFAQSFECTPNFSCEVASPPHSVRSLFRLQLASVLDDGLAHRRWYGVAAHFPVAYSI